MTFCASYNFFSATIVDNWGKKNLSKDFIYVSCKFYRKYDFLCTHG